ncbi:GNAT family N-acetyltransferase [Bifidobacterium pullorum subsp. saeculare]|uniref:GNAT family N-acetyltransferase n=1 Tax=Bifidobacterium pullorum subsp. saeculare TaxID=78257 RepID=A0A939BAA6_9BIFI|nr:GNAT family N-acetyltransferase [Bifidobacterium pullorum]MBM6699681.1 GNAT family N-acetyltransferase [Bifidobacterium pullorum subsp. saeculare]
MVNYRPMRWTDVDAICEEFDRTWGQCSPACADPDASMLLSRHFTLHYLEPATRGEIAEADDGTFLGVTLSRVDGQPVLFPGTTGELARVNTALAATGLGAAVLRDTEHWHQVEIELEDAIGINGRTQGEVELFLVSAAARGHGVGGTLWRNQMAYFAGHGVDRYYLHTDSSCDIGFYEHQGLDREAERFAKDHPEDAPDGGESTMDDIFIYAGSPVRAVAE